MITIDLTTLAQLNSKSVLSSTDTGYQSLRQKALSEAALTLGVQGGLYEVSQFINGELEQLSGVLYRIYNFNALLLKNNVLPPVLESGYNLSSISQDAKKVILNGQTYHFVHQAHFVSTAPTWRDYLIMHYGRPELPDRSVLPENEKEQIEWVKTLSYGWEKGIEQGMEIFKQRLHILNRDYNGMLIYFELLNRNMVVSPYVHKSYRAIDVSKNDLSLGNQNWQMTLVPQFQSDTKRWELSLHSPLKKALATGE